MKEHRATRAGWTGIVCLLVISAIFGYLSLAQLKPSLKEVTKESAQIQAVRLVTPSEGTRTEFVTSSGLKVKCSYRRAQGCDPDAMRPLSVTKKPLIVWHDGNRVYQVADKDKVIYAYEQEGSTKAFAAVIFALTLCAALIQIGQRKGWIGPPGFSDHIS